MPLDSKNEGRFIDAKRTHNKQHRDACGGNEDAKSAGR